MSLVDVERLRQSRRTQTIRFDYDIATDDAQNTTHTAKHLNDMRVMCVSLNMQKHSKRYYDYIVILL